MSTDTDETHDDVICERCDCAPPAARDLMDDLITAKNVGTHNQDMLAWIESLGLDPSVIPLHAWVISPRESRLYWREFKLNDDGVRCLVSASGESGYLYTRTKSMQLDSIPDFLN